MKPKTYNIIKWVFFPFFFFFCILQNLVGLGVFIYSKIRRHCKRIKTDDGIVYFEVDNNNPCYGVSLGYWIFLREYYKGDNITFHHEYGHQLQSLLLGPLYLILIGIPSGASNLWNTAKTDEIYYDYPWEKWADRWGGILHKNLKYDRELKS